MAGWCSPCARTGDENVSRAAVHHCVIGAQAASERDVKTDELMAAVGRLMRRG
jgi:hypothetical protein